MSAPEAEPAAAAASAAASILPRIRVVEYGVLGTQLVPGSGIVKQAEPPDDFTAFVDPAGLPFIQRAGPGGAGGASGSIYEHIGIRDDDAFPEDVVAAIQNECEAAYHRYETEDGGVHHCIHTVGPMLGYDKYSWEEAAEKLAGAYHNVLSQYISFATSRAEAGLPEGAAVRLRLLPISGGIFAGEYQKRIAPLTLAALAQGLDRLSDEARALLEREEGAPQVELCVFLAVELEAFRAALARALGGAPQWRTAMAAAEGTADGASGSEAAGGSAEAEAEPGAGAEGAAAAEAPAAEAAAAEASAAEEEAAGSPAGSPSHKKPKPDTP